MPGNAREVKGVAPEEHDRIEGEGTAVGESAIKWGAIVIIVLAVLYFFAQYVIPLFSS